MFLESMSGQELLNEYSADLLELQGKTLRYDCSDKVNKYLKKHHKDEVVVISRLFNTSRNNQYLGILVHQRINTGKNKDWALTSYHFGLTNTRKGLCAIAFYQQGNQTLILTPHFFNRYKERYSKLADWKTLRDFRQAKTLIDIIAIYFRRNLTITWIETDAVFRDTTHIFAPIDDGVALIQWDSSRKQLRANTFVTEDMLTNRQLKMVGYARAYIGMSPEERAKYDCPDFAAN